MTGTIRFICIGSLLPTLYLIVSCNVANAQNPTGKSETAGAQKANSNTALSTDTPNVVLGRELISVTKLLEDLMGLQEELLSLRVQISSPIESSTSVSALEADAQQLKIEFVAQHDDDVKSLRTQLQALDAELRKIADASAAPVASAPSVDTAALEQLIKQVRDLQSEVEKVVQNNAESAPAPPLEPAEDIPVAAPAIALNPAAVASPAHEKVGGIPNDQTAPARRNTTISELIAKLRDLENSIADEESRISEGNNQLRSLTQRREELEQRWNQRKATLGSIASRLDSLDRLVAASDIGSAQLVGLGAFGGRPFYQLAIPYAYAPQFAQAVDSFPNYSRSSEPPSYLPLSSDEHENARQYYGQIDSQLKRLEGKVRKRSEDLSLFEGKLKALKELSTEVMTETKSSDDRAGNIIKQLRQKLGEQQERKRAIENALSDRDSGLNQYQINQLLVYAVYAMVASIIGLFVMLRWYPASLTDLIVQQRVFVEVLSMGFLLVTIIILGSARLIQGEGLAGLLGTIAGYIFVKKTADMMTSQQNAESTTFVDRALGQAHLDIAKIQAELDEKRRLAGATPSEPAKAKLTQLESSLNEAQVRAKSLTEAMTSMAQAKMSRRPTDADAG